MFAFLGGFSSATSMVIVSTIALATMVSNHIVLPLWLATTGQVGAHRSGDVRAIILLARRLSIAGILTLGYLYFRVSGGGEALAAIGLVSFSGAVQVLPALIGGIIWRGATRTGAALGLIVGFSVWGWTLFLPSVADGSVVSATVAQAGPFGIGWLRPQALFGIEGLDPLVHGLMWSMLLNTSVFFFGSVFSFPAPLERLQGAQFVNVFDTTGGSRTWGGAAAQAEDLLIMAQRIVGGKEAQTFFQTEAADQGKEGFLPDVTAPFVERLERELSGTVGAATAHAMISQLIEGTTVSVDDLIAVADEAAQILEYSNQLEAKSAEQERTAAALREANEKLTALSVQKDAFLSQISHELRTPMTSIRSFSEILRDTSDRDEASRRYANIIHGESQRLTRLLDDLLDLSVLAEGQVTLQVETGQLGDVIDQAVDVAASGALKVERRKANEAIHVTTDLGRLTQVFINLISNAAKYCEADNPVLQIKVSQSKSMVQIDFVDNGTGIAPENRDVIFEKFSRGSNPQEAGGAGLGLAISREIMTRLGGRISYLPGQQGAAFRVSVPVTSNLALP